MKAKAILALLLLGGSGQAAIAAAIGIAATGTFAGPYSGSECASQPCRVDGLFDIGITGEISYTDQGTLGNGTPFQVFSLNKLEGISQISGTAVSRDPGSRNLDYASFSYFPVLEDGVGTITNFYGSKNYSLLTIGDYSLRTPSGTIIDFSNLDLHDGFSSLVTGRVLSTTRPRSATGELNIFSEPLDETIPSVPRVLPEPADWMLTIFGVALLGVTLRRRSAAVRGGRFAFAQ